MTLQQQQKEKINIMAKNDIIEPDVDVPTERPDSTQPQEDNQ